MVELTYRSIRTSDFDDLHAIVSYWSVVRQLGSWPWPADADFTRTKCKPFIGEGFVWAICINDRLVGTIGIGPHDLGYMLHPDQHSKGIITKAAQTAVNHAFTTSDRDYLTASTWSDNTGSYRVLQKLGFEHWQTRYMHAKARNRPTLVQHQRLTRDTWDRLRTAPQ